MKDREQYLRAALNEKSVLSYIVQDHETLINLTASLCGRAEVATQLEAIDSDSAKSRAEFIRRQLDGEESKELFDTWREQWGIPCFQEGLVNASDFQGGFMWRFRDHTTSWSENQYAQEWFLVSTEAQTITRYEFWSCDDGPDECIEVVTGSYKQILEELLEAGVHEVLISPVFTTQELAEFMHAYAEDENDFTLEEIVEDYISRNPNFVAE